MRTKSKFELRLPPISSSRQASRSQNTTRVPPKCKECVMRSKLKIWTFGPWQPLILKPSTPYTKANFPTPHKNSITSVFTDHRRLYTPTPLRISSESNNRTSILRETDLESIDHTSFSLNGIHKWYVVERFPPQIYYDTGDSSDDKITDIVKWDWISAICGVRKKFSAGGGVGGQPLERFEVHLRSANIMLGIVLLLKWWVFIELSSSNSLIYRSHSVCDHELYRRLYISRG